MRFRAALAALGVLLLPRLSWSSFALDATNTLFAPVESGAVITGDYDGDGDVDVALCGFSGATDVTKVYRNDSGTYTEVASLEGVRRGALAFGDYDNDGDLDLAVSGFNGTSTILKVYKNNGGTFVEAQSLTGMSQGQLIFADIDNDGDVDLVTCGSTDETDTGRTFQIYKSTGGTLAAASSIGITLFVRLADVAVADVDLDGDLDLVVMGSTGSGANEVQAWANNGSGVFSFLQDLPVSSNAAGGGIESGGLAVADYTGDGWPDVAALGSGPPRVFKLFANLAGVPSDTNRFSTTAPLSLAGVQNGKEAFADVDNDGDLDLAVCGTNDGTNAILWVLTNSGSSPYFTQSGTITLTAFKADNGALAFGDANGDNKVDLFVVGIQSPDTTRVAFLLTNDAATVNMKPSTPTSGLVASMVGGVLTLRWDAVTDTETPSRMMMYQVVVGTLTGGQEFSPAGYSSPLYGHFFPARLGSDPLVPGRWFTGLPANNVLYWRVRAIDTGLRPGDWSSEYAIYSGGVLTPSGGQGGHVVKGTQTTVTSGVVKDTAGNVVSGVPLIFTITKPNLETLTLNGTTGTDGTATVTVASDETTQPGIYTVDIKGNNIEINRQSLTFVVAVENKPDITVAPNPFTPTRAPFDKVGFVLPQRTTESAQLTLFDIGGAPLRKLGFDSGQNVEWDGRDERGEVVEGGIYLWQITFGQKRLTGTVVVAR